MIVDECLAVGEAVQWCAEAINHLEVTRLRQLTSPTRNDKSDDYASHTAETR
jgi:hypothetical protein